MEKPDDTLALTYETKYGSDTFLWRLPEGLGGPALRTYAQAAECAIILLNENDGWIEPADWREIVRLIAAKEFEAAIKYWQERCREGTYFSWSFVRYPEEVTTIDEIAAEAQATLADLSEGGGDGDDYYTGPEPADGED